jgi:hypothetical protein
MSKPDFAPPPLSYLYGILEKVAVGMGVCVLLITIFASWSTIGLRPTTSFSVGSEHIVAFGILGGCWGFAFPRRALQLLLILTLTAIVLEAGQIFVPGRHARLIDVATKIAGGGAGILAGILIAQVIRRIVPRRDASASR